MIVSITKIELASYFKLISFFKFNGQIIKELKLSKCAKFKMTGSWHLTCWYTMTLWKDEHDLHDFYRNGTHLAAMKVSPSFSSKIQSKRVDRADLMDWKEAKKLFV